MSDTEEKTFEVNRELRGLSVYYKSIYAVEICNEEIEDLLDQNGDLRYLVQVDYVIN